MGSPSKLNNETVLAIYGSRDYDNIFPLWLTFVQEGVATGSSYIDRAKAPLDYVRDFLTSLNTSLSVGKWEGNAFIYSGTTQYVKAYGSQGIFGEVNATRIEWVDTNPKEGATNRILLDGRFTINPYDFYVGPGDSISKILVGRNANTFQVKYSEVLDVSLSFDSKGVWYGELLQYTRDATKSSGDFSGYTYRSIVSYSGVDIDGVNIDRKTYWSDEKITSFSYKGYDDKGQTIFSNTSSTSKTLNLETDIAIATETRLSGNTLVSITGSTTADVSTYSGDDWIIDDSIGSNQIDGGDGNDLVEYLGAFSGFTVVRTGDAIVTVRRNAESNTLKNIESVKFNDKTILLTSLPINPKGPTDSNKVYVFKSESVGGNTPSFSFFYTTSFDEVKNIRSQPDWPWVQKPSTFEAAHSNAGLSVPVYRFWSDKHQSHFFTISPAERDQVISWSKVGTNGYDWKYEGEGFRVYTNSIPTDAALNPAIPVYRVWMDDKDFDPSNGISGGHFFTGNKNEYDQMIKLVGVKGEGVAFFGEPVD